MNKGGRNIFIVLLMLFILPGIGAIWFYIYPQFLSVRLVNKGHLFNPPILVHALGQADHCFKLKQASGLPAGSSKASEALGAIIAQAQNASHQRDCQRQASKHKNWQLVYVPKEHCTHQCLDALSQLAKIRLALGRKMYRLSLKLLVLSSVKAPSHDTNQRLKEMDIQVTTLQSIPKRLFQDKLWVVDPKGYVVISYRDQKHPKDIFSDLKHLAPLWG